LRRIRSLLVLVLAAGSLLAVAPTTANAACGTPNRRSLSGTVKGSDGRAVNVQIGLDLFDKADRPILANGCPKPQGSGYSPNLFLNSGLPASGGTGRVTWRAPLPSNAAYAYIETYPKDPRGRTDQSHYGHSMRRKVAAGASGVWLLLPVVCGDPGGLTGGIHGYVKDGRGRPLVASRVSAFSMVADSDPRRKIMGWNVVTPTSGFYGLYQLARNQPYRVFATYRGRTIRRDNVRVGASCHNTPLSFRF
jgi:hypothetical protein